MSTINVPKCRLTRRQLAIDTLGLERVESSEAIIAETIDYLLKSPELRRNGLILEKRSVRPLVGFRWVHGLSRGGRAGVRFAMLGHASKPDAGAKFVEYARLASDPVMGSYEGTREGCLRILAAHELAHWLQHSSQVTRPRGSYRQPHGTGFQLIYWVLRYILKTDLGIASTHAI